MGRVENLRLRLGDVRGRRVVLLSHCLLNENVRYLGGAGREAGMPEVVTGYLGRGIGVHQLPCPERVAWGGVLKRHMLVAFGAGGTWRAPASRALLPWFVRYTAWRYGRLAKDVVGDVEDYRRAGVDVVGYLGVGSSPSCGVRTTLDLSGAVDDLSRCPLARVDRRFLDDVIERRTVPGAGLFVCALRDRLARAGVEVPMDEHDLLAELGNQGAAG